MFGEFSKYSVVVFTSHNLKKITACFASLFQGTGAWFLVPFCDSKLHINLGPSGVTQSSGFREYLNTHVHTHTHIHGYIV